MGGWNGEAVSVVVRWGGSGGWHMLPHFPSPSLTRRPPYLCDIDDAFPGDRVGEGKGREAACKRLGDCLQGQGEDFEGEGHRFFSVCGRESLTGSQHTRVDVMRNLGQAVVGGKMQDVVSGRLRQTQEREARAASCETNVAQSERPVEKVL